MKNRVKRIFDNVREDVDAVVFMNDEEPNVDAMFPYATGTTGGLFEGCISIAWPNGRVALMTNQLEETSARHSKAEIIVFKNKDEKNRQIIDALGMAKRIGVNGRGLSFNNYQELRRVLPSAEFVDVGPGLLAARLVKDAEEIERLREACKIASKVAEEIPSFVKGGMTEYEAAAEINYRMQLHGASGPSFGTIASFGANCAEPHHEPDQTKCRDHDIGLFDYGGLYKRYGSDITRTFFIGKATPEQKRMYQVVLDAQLAAISVIKPGVNGKDVDAIARSLIDATEFKGRFIHSLGHSIGLAVHDGARMAPNTELILEEGMALTVEPGVYVPGVGGVRIEDDIVVTKKGCELLTTAPKDLTVI